MVTGSQIDLSDGRHVFYARRDKEHFLRFKNAEGVETKFKLSEEAKEALLQLLVEPEIVMRWEVRPDSSGDKMEWKADEALK